jgi:hypothetical protein
MLRKQSTVEIARSHSHDTSESSATTLLQCLFHRDFLDSPRLITLSFDPLGPLYGALALFWSVFCKQQRMYARVLFVL